MLARGLEEKKCAAIPIFMHTVPRVRQAVLEAEPNSKIEAGFLKQLREGALIARSLHELLAGSPAPSVNEKGQPAT
jgi:hypothetical protein